MQFMVGLIPYEFFKNLSGDDESDNEDVSSKSLRDYTLFEHPYFKFDIDSNTRVSEIKKQVVE